MFTSLHYSLFGLLLFYICFALFVFCLLVLFWFPCLFRLFCLLRFVCLVVWSVPSLTFRSLVVFASLLSHYLPLPLSLAGFVWMPCRPCETVAEFLVTASSPPWRAVVSPRRFLLFFAVFLLCYVVLCFSICCILLCCVALYFAVLCCVLLWYTVM